MIDAGRTGTARPTPRRHLLETESKRRGAGRRGLHALSAGLDRLGERVVLFRHGDFVFVTFGLFAALGAGVSLTWLGLILLGQGLPLRDFLVLVLAGSAAVVLGSWLFGQLLDYRLLLRDPRKALRRPVFVSWGGLIAMLAAVACFAHVRGFSLLLLCDALAQTVPLGHAIGRLGCLSYGCCFGRPTTAALAITYRNPHSKAVRVARLGGVRLHPAAFYEAVLDLLILLAVHAAVIGGWRVGVPTAMGFVLYGAGRFAIEFLRNNDGRMVFGGLSFNHFVSLGMVAVGAVFLPLVLLGTEPVQAMAWGEALLHPPWMMLTIVPGASLIFVGFSLHRGGVGAW